MGLAEQWVDIRSPYRNLRQSCGDLIIGEYFNYLYRQILSNVFP